VTEFVNALQEELAATIKDPLSIYFDKNPHDNRSGLVTEFVNALQEELASNIKEPLPSTLIKNPKMAFPKHRKAKSN
jgi:hypothetical protein